MSIAFFDSLIAWACRNEVKRALAEPPRVVKQRPAKERAVEQEVRTNNG